MGKIFKSKIFVLIAMAFALIIALNQIESKVQERGETRNAAVRSIAEQYATEQHWIGPLISISCSEMKTITETDSKGHEKLLHQPHDCSQIIRPKNLVIQSKLEVNERYRGIYKARVYLAKIKLKTTLPSYIPKPGQTVSTSLLFGVSDARGLKHIALTNASGQKLEAKPGVLGRFLTAGFSLPLAVQNFEKEQTINADLEIAGSNRLDFSPIAEQNDFFIQSSWPHPNFDGKFLPENREVSANGFNARWRVNDFATGGNTMLSHKAGQQSEEINIDTNSMGVSLIDPIDTYTQTNRAVRYGFLFILMTIGGFFIFEMVKQKTVHPLQYLLVGLAVVIFFLLLLALSEHLAFATSYMIAAFACVALISAYGKSIVTTWAGTAILAAAYSGLYYALYLMLNSEDYALLMGAWLIFAILALAMYLTRKFSAKSVNTTTIDG
ncbi:MAG: cell envelope integrity protein CreD [Pseudomonadota bacterium]